LQGLVALLLGFFCERGGPSDQALLLLLLLLLLLGRRGGEALDDEGGLLYSVVRCSVEFEAAIKHRMGGSKGASPGVILEEGGDPRNRDRSLGGHYKIALRLLALLGGLTTGFEAVCCTEDVVEVSLVRRLGFVELDFQVGCGQLGKSFV